MAPTMKKTAAAEQFRVPSLAEADPTYAALLQRQNELNERLSSLNKEGRDLDKRIAEQPKSPHSAGVSRLLGDPEDAVPHLRKRRREVSGEITDVETALGVIAKRLAAARNVASKMHATPSVASISAGCQSCAKPQKPSILHERTTTRCWTISSARM
jgi:hypothetical protein